LFENATAFQPHAEIVMANLRTLSFGKVTTYRTSTAGIDTRAPGYLQSLRDIEVLQAGLDGWPGSKWDWLRDRTDYWKVVPQEYRPIVVRAIEWLKENKRDFATWGTTTEDGKLSYWTIQGNLQRMGSSAAADYLAGMRLPEGYSPDDYTVTLVILHTAGTARIAGGGAQSTLDSFGVLDSFGQPVAMKIIGNRMMNMAAYIGFYLEPNRGNSSPFFQIASHEAIHAFGMGTHDQDPLGIAIDYSIMNRSTEQSVGTLPAWDRYFWLGWLPKSTITTNPQEITDLKGRNTPDDANRKYILQIKAGDERGCGGTYKEKYDGKWYAYNVDAGGTLSFTEGIDNSVVISPVAITAQPVAVTVVVGQAATFSVQASGSPAPAFQWYKNGTAIPGATTSSLSFGSVAETDAATYTATVKNSHNGTDYNLTTVPAVLTVTVIAPPIFNTHPMNQVELVGSRVTLSSAIQGLATTTFQWKKNGEPINGATNATLVFSLTATSDTGTYTVVATNSKGSTTSNAAELVINATVPPSISSAAANVTIPNGERTQLKVSATGTGTLSYQWYEGLSGNKTNPVSAATAATFTTPALTATASYWARITDGNGSVTNSPTVTVTVSATSPLSVTQQALGPSYSAGGVVAVTNTITYSGTAPSRIDWSTLLAAGWTYLGSGGTEGGARPAYESRDLLEWSWTTVPASPIKFTYTVSVPTGTTGDQVIASLVTSQAAGTSFQTMAKPDPLVLHSASGHSADSNRDGKISLVELTRVIELYNYRSGTSRTGQYKTQPGSEDGFGPGP